MRHFILTLLLLAVPALCSAEIYKWIDEKGQTGYSDDLGKVPKKYRDNAVITEKQEQAVEIIEKNESEKSPKKGAEGKSEPDSKGKGKDKPVFDGKSGDVWKQDFARQKYEVKSLEDQVAGIKERMVDPGKISRGEYVTLQNTQRDFDVRVEKAKKKLDALNDAAEKAGVPAEFR
jgi:hypothetical protein